MQTGHQDDSRTVLQIQIRRRTSHQFGQLVMHNLDHQLARLHRSQHVLPDSFLLHSVGERLGYFVVHVGIEQSATHVFQRFRYVDFGDSPLTFQQFERTL